MRGRVLLRRGAVLGLLGSSAGDAGAQPVAPTSSVAIAEGSAATSAPSPVPATPATAPGSSLAPPIAAAPAARADFSLAAYHDALAQQRLDATAPLGTEQLGRIIEAAEAHLSAGRRDEAIAVLAAVVESARFAPLSELDEGRAATFWLGDALGRAGAYAMARSYLVRLVRSSKGDSWEHRAIGRLVDFALSSGDPAAFEAELETVHAASGASWAGDVSYLRGILQERAGEPREALSSFAAVPVNSRFWSQATYRAGLLEVEQGRLGAGERQFCRIADPKQTPSVAPLFGGNDFFEVRDLSRLALGRVAHEQYRFDDARYYYHLVPGDSGHLPEALYESATSRYEAKDYASAHALLAELEAMGGHHAYEDEAYILDAYVDLARCEFPRADQRLSAFLARYEPVLAAVRQLSHEPRALGTLLGGSGEAQASELGWSPEVTDMLRAQIRVDPSYGRLTRQLADLEQQLGGLRFARADIGALSTALRGNDVVARSASPIADSATDRVARLDEQTASARRLLREAERSKEANSAELAAIRVELDAVEAEAVTLRGHGAGGEPPPEGGGLPEQLAREGALADRLTGELGDLRAALTLRRDTLAAEALMRFEKRLSRLVRRARAGRIETVLGRKRALELEVEALSQGFLPQGAVDSLDAARYLSDDEEYWPFDGEDWEDEYIGGEGLR
jgi:hypothetical protein